VPPVETESDGHDFFYWLQHAGEQKGEVREDVEKADKATQIRIIEKFVNANPTISRPKKEFFKAENMARKSEILDPDFVTETLAGIYAQSGNYTRAIEAYQKLSLQFPEKQAYFAALIEKISNDKKNKK
jgi:tetratricopeptide (TPR) repeat protein